MTTARVLVSEADPDVRRLLAALVERLGHEALVLGSADSKIPPEADLMLLEPDSTTCLEHARTARTDSPGLPVISLSLIPSGGEFLSEGPLQFLPKPFTLDQLRTVVERSFHI
jgi:DNA-binding NtrC family response regulator